MMPSIGQTRPSPDLSSIAFGARAESRLFLFALAREMRVRHDSQIHLYCNGPQEVDYYRKLDREGTFASINDQGELRKRAFDRDLIEAEVIARAQVYEARTGVTINRMAVPHRHFGRGYALGGFYHPRSRHSEQVDYLHMVHAYCATLAYWEREFAEKRVALCINGTREAAWMARAHGIPYRAIAGSKLKNYHYWAWNEMYETPSFERAWRCGPTSASEVTMDAPYHAHQANRGRYLRSFATRAMLWQWGLTTAYYVYWNVRRYEKAKAYYYTDTLRYHYHVWRDYRRLRRLELRRLTDLDGRRFVYFHLHIEPETALHGISPEYFYQHALIAAVSRDLPAGCCLAVKEAYGAIGRRPADFYEQIADLKNVVLLDVWERGFDCAQRADAVVTICGTAGLEAIVAGKPVIAFGRHNLYNFLPSVRVVHDEAQLAGYLREALDGRLDRETIRAEGRRLLEAIVAGSFDMGTYDYIALDGFERAAVEAAYQKLLESLADTDAADAAMTQAI
jgi:hypothetical protein